MNTIALPLPAEASRRNLFWQLQCGGWLGYFVLHFLAAMGDGREFNYIFASFSVAVCGLATTSVLRLGYKRLWPLPMRRSIPGAALLLVAITVVQMKLGLMITLRFCDDIVIRSIFGYLWYFAAALYLLLSWSGLYVGIKLFRQLQQQKEKALLASNAAHAAQLKMLRYQLNPHFLFNTLNAISTLVLDDQRDTAYRMIGNLSTFLRHSLDSDPEQLIPLSQEVEALELYLGIERVRFADRLSVVIDVAPQARGVRVPSLILQPLVENAIKYAVSRNEKGGCIELLARCDGDMLDLHLRDDGPGPGAKSAQGAIGVGLANTRERLRVLYGERQHLGIAQREAGGTDVHLRLPLTTAGTA